MGAQLSGVSTDIETWNVLSLDFEFFFRSGLTQDVVLDLLEVFAFLSILEPSTDIGTATPTITQL